MKAKRFLIVLFVLLFAGTLNSEAKGLKAEEKTAIHNLNNDLKVIFKTMPFDEIICRDKTCSISICFKVNEDNKLEIIHVVGKDQNLVEYANEVLSNKEIESDHQILNNEFYWVKMSFQNRTF